MPTTDASSLPRSAAARPHPTTIHAHWRAAARAKGFEITRRVDDRYHLMLRCDACGLEHKSRIYVVMSSRPLCPHCTSARWREDAAAAGLVWIGRDPENRRYGRYRAPCGHVLRRQFELVKRIAAGACGHRCEICHDEKEQAEARARGWTLLGPDPSGDAIRRLYRHRCGHEQVVARVNMKTGRLVCGGCGTGWATAPSFLYCMRFEPDGAAPLVKLGFSRDPDSRLHHQLKRSPDLRGTVLRQVPVESGRKALVIEKRMHAQLRAAHPEALTEPGRYRRWIRVRSEVYDARLEPVILAMLDRIAAANRTSP